MANILFDIALIIIFATFFAYIARVFKQPLLVAYIIAGFVIGPMGMGFITDSESIRFLAELGVAFLLFTVGLEIDFQKLKSIGKVAVVGGILQIIITFIVGYLLSRFLGFSGILSLYLGLLLAFSSTMIVTKSLIDRDKLKTIYGRIMVGILLVQDIVVILVLPMFTNIEAVFRSMFLIEVVLKGLGLLAIAIVLNRFLLPKVLDYAAEMRELLFLTAISICFAFIGFSYALGFSIIIGAFIAGIALGRFPYDLEILGETRALMEFFAIIFFTTLGIQLNLGVVLHLLPQFIIFLIGLMVVKPFALYFMYMFMGYGSKISSQVGFGLAQASEFTFVIALQGLVLGQLSTEMYSFIISLVVVSMFLTPYIIRFEESIYKVISRLHLSGIRKFAAPRMVSKLERKPEKLEHHIVLFGCHLMGERIAEYLRHKKKDVVIVDHNPEIVRDMSAKGFHTIYGDMENQDVLRSIKLTKAKMIIITAPVPRVAAFIIKKLKKARPRAKAIARAYTLKDEKMLYENKADFVVVPDKVSAERMIEKISKYL